MFKIGSKYVSKNNKEDFDGKTMLWIVAVSIRKIPQSRTYYFFVFYCSKATTDYNFLCVVSFVNTYSI